MGCLRLSHAIIISNFLSAASCRRDAHVYVDEYKAYVDANGYVQDMSYHSFQLDLLDFLWSYHVVFVVLEVVAIAVGHGDVQEQGTVDVVLASSGYITRSAPDRRGSSGKSSGRLVASRRVNIGRRCTGNIVWVLFGWVPMITIST